MSFLLSLSSALLVYSVASSLVRVNMKLTVFWFLSLLSLLDMLPWFSLPKHLDFAPHIYPEYT